MKKFFHTLTRVIRKEKIYKMNAVENDYDGLVVGLKKNVVKFKNHADYNKTGLNYAEYNLLKSWKMLYNAGLRTEVETMIWTYVDKTDGLIECLNPERLKTPDACRVEKKGSSKLIGRKSIIADYTNKKGKTHKAHYSYQVHNNCYIGRVSELGNEPIYFTITTDITKSNGRLNINKLATAEKISDLFELIEESKVEVEKEEEVKVEEKIETTTDNEETNTDDEDEYDFGDLEVEYVDRK